LVDGSPVLLLHGWPTSSFLWREVMQPISRANHVVALDLPGFDGSDKPVGIRYGFEFFDRALDFFLAHLGIDQLGLAVHDLGGPVGLHWALDRPLRLTKLALLNTLVYPEFSEAVKEFVRACATPELREKITSASGLESIMRDEPIPRSSAQRCSPPCKSPFARPRPVVRWPTPGSACLARDSCRSRASCRRFTFRSVSCTGHAIRVKIDLPQADVSLLPNCGHFLQEEAPAEVGEMLARFFAP
jgi:haloalkane dehalogenase